MDALREADSEESLYGRSSVPTWSPGSTGMRTGVADRFFLVTAEDVPFGLPFCAILVLLDTFFTHSPHERKDRRTRQTREEQGRLPPSGHASLVRRRPEAVPEGEVEEEGDAEEGG